MKAHQKTVGTTDEWLTPPHILEALGEFDLDPCAPAIRPWPTAKRHISLPDNGLLEEWDGRVWLNPPFNRYNKAKWMRKMALHGSGIMLIPAATETPAFDSYVWSQAQAVCFIKGRLHFHRVDGTRSKANCGTAIVLVAYGQMDAQSPPKRRSRRGDRPVNPPNPLHSRTNRAKIDAMVLAV